MVLERGYVEVLFDGLSRYFIHQEHRHRGQALALSPNIFDGFQVPANHFSANMLAAAQEAAIEAARQEFQADRNGEAAAALAQAVHLQERLQEQAQAHIAALAEAQVAATEAASRLEAAEQQVAKQEHHNAEQARSHLVASRVAHDRIAYLEEFLADANNRLVALQHDQLALARENGRLEGQLAVQVEAHTAQLADAAAARRGLASSLTSAEQRLAIAEAEAASVRAELGVQARDHDATLRTLHAVQDDVARLHLHITWREQQLQQAAALLGATPSLLAELPGLLVALVRRAVGGHRLAAIVEHQVAVAHWLSGAMLPVTPTMLQGEILSLAGNLVDANEAMIQGLGHKGCVMLESHEPITSVSKLLAPHDRHFIHTAYQAVLGRAPDAAGESHYLSRLRAGDHKLTILKQLRQSPEGRAFIPGVAGLDRAIKRHGWATMPMVGPLVRLVLGAEGNSATHRQLRVLVNEMGQLRGEQSVLVGFVRQLAARPVVVAEASPQPAAVPPPPPPTAMLQPPRLDPGPMPDNFDSTERRLLGSLRMFALTRGAPA
jgi:hypothetical protein